ncbi:MAG: flagellar hook-length control protein FliK [Phycisphaerales bacterium]|nr:flagellar hook-length control protein FliK [Phycisphaerales bacterium]
MPATPAAGALLAPLLNVTEISDETIAARDSIDQRADRKREADDDARRRHDDLAAQVNGGAAAQARSAEREMRPGSQSLARDQARGAAFRQEWQSASRSAAQSGDRAAALKTVIGSGSSPDTTAQSVPSGDSSAGVMPASASAASTAPAIAKSDNAPLQSASTSQSQTPSGSRSVNAATHASSTPIVSAIQSAAVGTEDAAAVAQARDSGNAATSNIERSSSTTAATTRSAMTGIASTRENRPSLRQIARPSDAPDVPQTGKNEALSEQLVRVLRMRINEKHTQTTLRLDPPALGSVRMHMDLRDNQLALRVEPQSELAHRLLSEQADSLRVALEASGIQLQRVEIVPPTESAMFEAFGGHEQTAGNPPQFGDARHDGAERSGRPEEGVRSGGAPRSFESPELSSIGVSELLGYRSGVNVLA